MAATLTNCTKAALCVTTMSIDEADRAPTATCRSGSAMLAGIAKSTMVRAGMVLACALAAASPCTAQDGAFTTARQMAGGVNILGYDGIWDGGADAPFKQRYFKMIRDAGFHHVRINLSAFKYMDSRNELDPRVLARLDWVLEQAATNDLIPVIDEHDYDQCQRNPDDCAVKLLAFWKRLADQYANRFPAAVFELLNEPGGKMTAAWWNAFIQSALQVIRANNPQRTVIVAAINSDDPLEIRKLQLPPQDRNIIVTVHYYKPMQFTHQGAPWSWRFALLRDIVWGSEDDKSRVTSDLETIAAWGKEKARPIYLGEFGVYEGAPMDARVRYTSFVAHTAERLGWPWAYWQFDHDFALFDGDTGEWITPLINGLMSHNADDETPERADDSRRRTTP
jgi:endoglucanase